jgi:hypothetical protein
MPYDGKMGGHEEGKCVNRVGNTLAGGLEFVLPSPDRPR